MRPISGLCFVVIQHLDPTQKSLATELFAKRTQMSVAEAQDGVRALPDHVYTVPPGREVTIRAGALHLEVPETTRGQRMPIDRFFQSLGDDQQEKAIGIVMSGTGADGAQGLKSIAGNGGIVLVQRPDTAQFDGMPRAALATGLATHVLAVEDMPVVLLGYANHPYAAHPESPAPAAGAQEALLRSILDLVLAKRGHDFTGYKRATLLRRIHRRMGLSYIESMADYAAKIAKEPHEIDALFKDFLIGATEFFRDPEAWQALETEAIAPMVAVKGDNEPIRVRVPGVSTGEEGYTVAMILLEAVEKARKRCPLQIFATDINEEALAVARMGIYPAGIATQVPSARLHRFFNEIDDGRHYQVTSELRGRVVFGAQNLFSDPPFSGVDLVICRNVLIYLEPEVQSRVFLLLHFALKPDGFLFLGNAETPASCEDLFKPLAKGQRIYRRVGSTRREQLSIRAPGGQRAAPPGFRVQPPAAQVTQAARVAQQILFDRFAPASVLVSRDFDTLYFAGATERFLVPPRGAPTHSLLSMSREGLRSRLRGAIAEAAAGNTSVVVRDAQVKRGRTYESVRLTVVPTAIGESQRAFLVVFEDELKPPAADRVSQSKLVKQLEEELQAVREDLRATVEGLETSNEELKVANEEIVSVNEELQSSNEELQSSREELQSFNEELNTLNQQLQMKIGELEVVNNDLKNLLAINEVATLCLDHELRIKWFNPAAHGTLGLIATDVGRSILVFGMPLLGRSLQDAARAVLEKMEPVQSEVMGEADRWYQRRTVPYRTDDKRIDGVIVTFTDVTDSKRAAEATFETNKLMTEALERRVEERTRQLRTLSFELARAEENERQAIARDLHDDLGQLLLVAKLKLGKLHDGDRHDRAAAIRELEELVDRASRSMQSLAFQLSPAVLHELGLIPALEWLAEEMNKDYGLFVELADDGASKPLSQDARSILFRAIRELLINIARHSGVTAAEVVAQRSGESLLVVIRDRGAGFDPDKIDAQGAFGLTNVRERISFIGGSVRIASAPGSGAEVTLAVPLQVQEHATPQTVK
jgi:chemotaxis methyl-accepting protein methylase/signal transduction histidine kinase